MVLSMTLNCSHPFAFHTMTSSFDQDMALKEAMQDQQFIDSDILEDLNDAIRETQPEDWTPEEYEAFQKLIEEGENNVKA